MARQISTGESGTVYTVPERSDFWNTLKIFYEANESALGHSLKVNI